MRLPDSASLQRTQRGDGSRSTASRWATTPADRTAEPRTARHSRRRPHDVDRRAVVPASNANGSNYGSVFVMLEAVPRARHARDVRRRRSPQKLRAAVRRGDRRRGRPVFRAPPIQGLGNAGGFQFRSSSAATSTSTRCREPTDELIAAGQRGAAAGRPVHACSAPTRRRCIVDIDRTKCKSLGVAVNDVFNTLQVYLGGYLRQRLQRVRPHLAGEPAGRAAVPHADSSRSSSSRSATSSGEMVPLGTLLRASATSAGRCW